MTEATSRRRRVGLVDSGGRARGAYEAGVLAHLFEEIYPQLPVYSHYSSGLISLGIPILLFTSIRG